MSSAGNRPVLDYASLKAKHRALRAGFPDGHALRMHRSLSWLNRAEQDRDDPDVRFILLWISFNAAYASEVQTDATDAREEFRSYFELLVKHDRDQRIYSAVWTRFPHEIRLLLSNEFIFAPYWKHKNGAPGYENWRERLDRSSRSINAAMAACDTVLILCVVFDRLYVLRNQLVHGGATWNGRMNRDQVRDGAAVLTWLLPIFIDIMMDHPKAAWGEPFYPVIVE